MTTLVANKYGSNQFANDPRQTLCWNLYTTPGTMYFSNAYKSAIQSGYTSHYGRIITNTRWFYENIRKMVLLSDSLREIERILETNHIVPVIKRNKLMRDEYTGQVLYKVDADILKIKVELAMFICNKFGKSEVL